MNNIVSYIRQSLQELYPAGELKTLVMIICCDMLGLDAIDLYLGKDINLSASKERELENIIFRLQKNEPIQYVRSLTNFLGLELHVEPGVLIPRPETEELAELIIKENPGCPRILDIGTGSGCIAIALAKNIPDAHVTAWDISEKALAIASFNNKKLAADVHFEKKDILVDSLPDTLYDVIVSNPPYVRNVEKREMDSNVLDWEPAEALFVPDEDPLLFYRHIAQAGQKILAEGGKLYFEINQAYGMEIAGLLESYHYRDIRIIKDFFGKDRIVTANR